MPGQDNLDEVVDGPAFLLGLRFERGEDFGIDADRADGDVGSAGRREAGQARRVPGGESEARRWLGRAC